MQSKKINVLYFLDEKGIGHYTVMLANAVSKKINVMIIGQKKSSDLDYIDPDIEIRNVLRFPIGWSIRNLLSFKNMFIINTIKPDVIHVTSSYPVANAMIGLFFSGKNPLVVTVHDPRPHIGEVEYNLRSIFVDFFHMLLIKRSDKLIVHSEKLKSVLARRKIPPGKISVIPHGDYSFFAGYKSNKPAEKNCILFFGKIIKYKGLEYLIKAVAAISKEIPAIKVIIAGEGNFTEYKKLINGIPVNCFEVHNEFIPDRMVADLFERAQLLVLPYIEATQSGPLHIAYAFKKPVIATTVGGFPELVEHGKTGLLVPPNDENALAEAIIRLLKNDELRREMGENAYRKMQEEMSWDKIAEKTIEVYKEAIELHPGFKNNRQVNIIEN